MSPTKTRLTLTHDERIAHLTLNAPKANIVDQTMLRGIDDALKTVSDLPHLHALILAAEGPHFSFGASVEEHLPGEIDRALPGLHATIARLLNFPLPTIAAVRGQCLGGGFELVLACDLVVAESSAAFGCPEIKLGVFAPAASALLGKRIGLGFANRMLLTGESVSGTEASAMGLVTRVCPEHALQDTLDAVLQSAILPRSPIGLRYATEASRRDLRVAIEDLSSLEAVYLQRFMNEVGATEGIHAFLEKREPSWSMSHPADGITSKGANG